MNNYSTHDNTVSGGAFGLPGREEASPKSDPHTDNMGVSFPKPAIHCDYLTLTARGVDWAGIYDTCLFPFLDTELVDQNHGGRFYGSTWRTSLGVTIRCNPYGGDDNGDTGDRWTLEIPGQACEVIGYEGLCNLYQTLQREGSLRVNRLDLAVDNCPFKPSDLNKSAREGAIRTKSHRETVGFRENYAEINEVGGVGTEAFFMGSRESGRYLRCYDKHGPTRFEVEYKAEWADRLAVDFFIDGSPWDTGIGYIRDFVDFLDQDVNELRNKDKSADLGKHLVGWWAALVNDLGRAGVKLVQTAKEITVKRVQDWIEHQVSAAFSIVVDLGELNINAFTERLMIIGSERRERSNTYKSLLAAPC